MPRYPVYIQHLCYRFDEEKGEAVPNGDVSFTKQLSDYENIEVMLCQDGRAILSRNFVSDMPNLVAAGKEVGNVKCDAAIVEGLLSVVRLRMGVSSVGDEWTKD